MRESSIGKLGKREERRSGVKYKKGKKRLGKREAVCDRTLTVLFVMVSGFCGGIVNSCIVLLGMSGGKDGSMGSGINSSASSSGSRAFGRGLKFRMGIESQLGRASGFRLIVVPRRRSVA